MPPGLKVQMKPKWQMQLVAALIFAGAMTVSSAAAISAEEQGNQKQSSAQNGDAKAATTQLESLLSQMDTAAASFKSAQAKLESDQYQKVVNEMDTQKGTVYFRRANKNLQMALDITEPEKKYVLMQEGKIQFYQPNIEQVTVYSIGKSRSDVEGMMALGFGGRGHDLLKTFQVKLAGSEVVDGVSTSKLELVPKGDKLRNMFSVITLWIDAARGVSLKQEFTEPSGDYRIARYSDIRLNQKLSDDVFKLKTTSRTKIITPQS
jgi:outer membrane lipoprotein-sorting protein